VRLIVDKAFVTVGGEELEGRRTVVVGSDSVTVSGPLTTGEGDTPMPVPEIAVIGGLRVFPLQRRATLEGDELNLTAMEFDLLVALAHEPDRVFTKQELMKTVWAWPEGHNGTRTLDSHASRLRKKLGGRYVRNVWGVGYRLAGPELQTTEAKGAA
jgi:DNA-binding response OmpR family regulator